MNLGIQGRVAVVTGSSAGIGKAIALTLAEAGVNLLLCARHVEPFEATLKAIDRHGVDRVAIAADVSTVEGCELVAASATDRFGPVDILINNAGDPAVLPFSEITEERWRYDIDMHLMSAVRLSVAFLPTMIDRGWGRFVHISSRQALEPELNLAAYGAAKAALINFSKALTNGFSSKGVLSNCIVPGSVLTEGLILRNTQLAWDAGQSLDEYMAQRRMHRPTPIGRPGEPEEVAALAAFLASENAPAGLLAAPSMSTAGVFAAPSEEESCSSRERCSREEPDG